jgi:hypothetical protein
MCIFKECPIYQQCEKELEQVIYCRHVEMIKKIGQMRKQMQTKIDTSTIATETIFEPIKTISEPKVTVPIPTSVN